jgi:chromosome segregation ATPase
MIDIIEELNKKIKRMQKYCEKIEFEMIELNAIKDKYFELEDENKKLKMENEELEKKNNQNHLDLEEKNQKIEELNRKINNLIRNQTIEYSNSSNFLN